MRGPVARPSKPARAPDGAHLSPMRRAPQTPLRARAVGATMQGTSRAARAPRHRTPAIDDCANSMEDCWVCSRCAEGGDRFAIG